MKPSRICRPRAWSAFGVTLAGLVLAACHGPEPARPAGAGQAFSFIAAGDMRNFAGPAPAGKRYFDGACEALQTIGPGAFLLSPGDCDPPGPVRAMLDLYLGTNYLWYPVVGNHETEKTQTMAWFRQWAQAGIPNLVRRGPPGAEWTSYSFDFGNSHFVALNEYYDGQSDAVRKDGLPEAAFQWLEADLAATRQPLRWVFGHKPIESLADMDAGRLRHAGESVSTNTAQLARFVNLLQEYRVRAYICGHTHNASVTKVKGVWQLDSGHVRGAGDTNAPSTFLKVRVDGIRAAVDVYRADVNGQNYRLRKTVQLE